MKKKRLKKILKNVKLSQILESRANRVRATTSSKNIIKILTKKRRKNKKQIKNVKNEKILEYI